MSELRTVEAFVVDAINTADVLPDIPGCPLSVEERRVILANCPVYIINPTDETPNYLVYTSRPPTDAYDTERYRIWQPGRGHVRSFVLSGPGLDAPWHDEYGNRYTAFTLKGINFTNPGIMEHPVSTDGVVAWGFQESKIIGRVLAASEVLTRRGINTECIIGLAEPKEFPWPIIDGHTDAHEYISLGEYKQRIIDGYWRQLPEDERTIEALFDLTKKFSDMTFYVSLRAMDIPYRLGDLYELGAAEAVFAEINKNHLRPGERSYDPDRLDDVLRYISVFFAPRAGETLAGLHEDLAHGYTHSLNWTALGGIIDLDSVHGEGLGTGDTPVTNTERAKDIVETIFAIESMICPGITPWTNELRAYSKTAITNFLNGYFDATIERLGESQKTTEYLGEIIAWFGTVLDNEGQDDPVYDDIIRVAMDLYRERFFPEASSVRPEEQEAALQRAIEVLRTDEILADTIDAVMLDRASHYAQLIIEDNINKIVDPAFDPVDHFIAHPRSSEAWGWMVGDVMQAIVQHASRSAGVSTQLPSSVSDIKDPLVRAMVAGSFVGARQQGFKEYAESVVAARLPLFVDLLKDRCNYVRPESILPGHNTEPFVSPEAKRFVMATDGVSLDEVWAFIDTFKGEKLIGELPKARGSGIQLYIRAEDAVNEIITSSKSDGMMLTAQGGRPGLEVYFGAEATDYVLLVCRTPEGNSKLGMFLRDYTDFKTGRDAEQYIQDSLFA